MVVFIGAIPGGDKGGWSPQNLAGWDIVAFIPSKSIAIGKHCVNLYFAHDQQKYALKMCESAFESYWANIFILLKYCAQYNHLDILCNVGLFSDAVFSISWAYLVYI